MNKEKWIKERKEKKKEYNYILINNPYKYKLFNTYRR